MQRTATKTSVLVAFSFVLYMTSGISGERTPRWRPQGEQSLKQTLGDKPGKENTSWHDARAVSTADAKAAASSRKAGKSGRTTIEGGVLHRHPFPNLR